MGALHQQVFDGFGFAQVGWQDCRREPDFLGGITTIPHAGHLDWHCPDPRDHFAFWQVTMAHQPRAASF